MQGPDPRYDAYRQRRTFTSLDGLRALCIGVVVWHHSDVPPLAAAIWPAGRFGFLGVDLFFAISGYLIVTLLLRERERRGDISLKNFYIRRALRIWPVYYGLLLAFAVLYLGLKRGSEAGQAYAHDLPWLLLYLTNWVPAHGLLHVTWSLAAEEQFYFIWPPVEKWLRGQALTLVLVIIAVSVAIQLGVVDPLLQRAFGWAPNEPAMLRETGFTPISLGVLLAHLMHRRGGFVVIDRLLGARWVAPLLLAVLVGYCNLLPAEISGLPRLGVHVLMLLLLAACVVREDHGLHGVLTWRPLARIGALSYGIYLFHQICLGGARAVAGKVGLGHPVVVLVLGSIGVWIVAEISFRYYESWFLKRKERFGA